MVSDPIRNPALRKSLLRLFPLARPIFDQREFPFDLWEQIQQTPEYQHCARLMTEDATIARHIDTLVGTWMSRIRREVGNYLVGFFRKVCEKPLVSYEEVFENVYQQFERFFFVDGLETEVVAPLSSFSLQEEGEIDLGEGIRIEKLPPDIQAEFHKVPSEVTPSLDFWQRASTKVCLYSVLPEKKVIGDRPENEAGSVPTKSLDITTTMQRHLGCLRLFQPGAVGTSFIMRRIKGWTPVPFGFSWLPGSISPFPRPTYTVGVRSMEEFATFCAWCSKALHKATREIDIANRRFNFAYERPNPEDALIDLVIALESLFLNGEAGEFGYRLGMRVAGLLGRTRAERQKIFAFISFSYKLRNKVVHGEEVPKDVKLPSEGKVDFKSFLSRLEDYVRQCIRKALEMGLSRRERIKELERRILSGPEAETKHEGEE